jgi:hypothetical protein
MVIWKSAAPQICIHKSGNITAVEKGEISGSQIYNRTTYTRI